MLFFKSMKIQMFALTMMLPISMFAADQICEDLHRLTCAPGTYDDGTGSATNPTTNRGTGRTMMDRVPKLAKEKFLEALKKPENVQFRRVLRSASGLSMNPDCETVEQKPEGGCLELLADAATDVMGRALFATGAVSSSSIPLDMLMFITDAPVYKEVLRDVVAQVRQDPGQQKTEAKIRDEVFPRVRELLVKRVASLVQDESTRKKMIDKIRDIRFSGSACVQGAKSEETITDILTSNAYYMNNSNTFTYCAGSMLSNTSEFQMAHTIAHELSHSIDPCRIAEGPAAPFRYAKTESLHTAENRFPIPVLNCLRGTDSANAYRTPRGGGAYYGSTGGIGMPKPNSETSNPNQGYFNYGISTAPGMGGSTAGEAPFDGFCQNDQINEAFCDWMAYEVLPEYMQHHHPKLTKQQLRLGYSNVWRGSCQQPDASGNGGTHPVQARRVDYLLLMQPQVRTQLGCPATVEGRVYCEPKLSSDAGGLNAPSVGPNATPTNPATPQKGER